MNPANNIGRNGAHALHAGIDDLDQNLPREPIRNAEHHVAQIERISPSLMGMPLEAQRLILEWTDFFSRRNMGSTNRVGRDLFLPEVRSISAPIDELASMLHRYTPDQLPRFDCVKPINPENGPYNFESLRNAPLQMRQRITSLHLNHLTAINAGEIVQLTSCFPRLQRVDLAVRVRLEVPPERRNEPGYLGLNDWALVGLAENSPNLIRLTLHGCAALTDASIDTLVNQFPRLEIVVLTLCTSISSEALLSLRNARPALIVELSELQERQIQRLVELAPVRRRLDVGLNIL